MWCSWLPLLLAGAAVGQDSPAQPGDKSQPAYVAEFKKLKAETEKLQKVINKEYAAAKTDQEREALLAKGLFDKSAPLAARAIALVRPHAADKEAVPVLAWILNYHSKTPSASEAARLLAEHHLKDPQTLDAASRFTQSPMPWTEKLLQAVAGADLPRERKARAELALAECVKTKVELPALMKNLDSAMTRTLEAGFGKEYLAELQAADPAQLEERATGLYAQAAVKFGSEKYGSGTVADYVERVLFEMKHLRIGKPAPDIEGEDIDGSKFKLSDYRGKVVVLDFWGNW